MSRNKFAGLFVVFALVMLVLSQIACIGSGGGGGGNSVTTTTITVNNLKECSDKGGTITGNADGGKFACKVDVAKAAQDAVEQLNKATEQQVEALKEKAKDDLQKPQGNGYDNVQKGFQGAAETCPPGGWSKGGAVCTPGQPVK